MRRFGVVWPCVVGVALSATGCFNPDDNPSLASDTDSSGMMESTAGVTSQPTTTGPTTAGPTTMPTGGTDTDATSTTDEDTDTDGDTETKPDAIPGTPFSILELTDQTCVAADTSGTIESHRGGIGIVDGRVIGHGLPAALSVEAAGLASAAIVQTPYAQRDFVFSDLETKSAYLLGTEAGPLLRSAAQLAGEAVVVTQLYRLDERGRVTSDAALPLSTPITIADGGSGAGLFHGFGEAAIVSGNELSTVDLADGTVEVQAHTYDAPPADCDNGLHYGVLEQNFSFSQLLYFRFGRLFRQEVGSAAIDVADLGCFWIDVYNADAGFTSCSLTIDVNTDNPDQSRWVASTPLIQETSARQTLTDCAVDVDLNVAANAFLVSTFPNYDCSGTDPSSCEIYDSTNSTAGADSGPVLIAGDRFLFTGTEATVSYARVSDDVETGQRTGTILDSVVTDLGTGVTYVFALEGDGIEGAHSAGQANRLIPIDASGQPVTAQAVTLSQTLIWGSANEAVGLFSGYGRVLLYDGTRVLDVDPVSGEVTNRGNLSIANAQTCAQQAFYGIAELAEGNLRLVFRQSGSNTIVRRALGSANTEDVATFSDLADTCSILADPSRDTWYFSHAGASSLSDAAGAQPDVDMVLGSCEASFDVR